VTDGLAISAEGVSKHFFAATSALDLLRGRLRGRRIDAVRGIALAVARGETVGVVGPNGAGKTTLLRLLAGLLLPDAGTLDVLGEAVARTDHRFRRRVCYVVCDERSFSWRLSGRQNLEFFAALHRLAGGEARGRVTAALARVGLEGEADRAVREYSSGMRQRLALARGLLGDPELLLLDEPTRGVDPLCAEELRRFIREELVGEGKRTALVATHNLREVQTLCDRVVVLDAGRVVGEGSAADAARILGVAP